MELEDNLGPLEHAWSFGSMLHLSELLMHGALDGDFAEQDAARDVE